MSGGGDLASTATLLVRARAGDGAARDALFERFLPLLARWAHGRLPRAARGAMDTQDLVQTTLLRALARLDDFEPEREGAFLAYLRRILLNALRDELRRVARRPGQEPLEVEPPAAAASAVELAIGREALERYEAALERLDERPREAVLLRIEFGYGYREIAEAIGAPSADAARMVVQRALVHLGEALGRDG